MNKPSLFFANAQNKVSSGHFHSFTYGELSFEKVAERIIKIIKNNPDRPFKIVVGCDSQKSNGKCDFVTAIVLHHIGRGGIYFWQRELVNGSMVLRERIYHEATHSLNLAQELVAAFSQKQFQNYNLEIHVDIGNVGETRVMINEVVGMIRGSGFACKTKPEAYGAASVADRHT